MELEYKFYLKSNAYLNEVLHSNFWNEFKSDPWSKHHFIAKYYDTKDLILSENKFSLRIRKEDNDNVLTVKTPKFESDSGELSLRGEWNYLWQQDKPDISFLIDSLEGEIDNTYIDLMKSVKDEELYSNMTTDVIRYKKNILLSETQIEVVLDSGKLFGGKLSDEIHEMELELISGEETILFELVKVLKERFELMPGNKSKMQRCYELLEKSRKLS